MRSVDGPGFVGIDMETELDDDALLMTLQRLARRALARLGVPPRSWAPAVISDPARRARALAAVAGDKYSYRELDDFTDLIKRTLQNVPQVSKVTRAGVLQEQVYLDYSQELLAGAAEPSRPSARRAQHHAAGRRARGRGQEPADRSVGRVQESSTRSATSSSATSETGRPVYLRDLVDDQPRLREPGRGF